MSEPTTERRTIAAGTIVQIDGLPIQVCEPFEAESHPVKWGLIGSDPILPPPLQDTGSLETMATPLIEAIARVLRDADHGCDWETYVADAQAALTAITEAGYAIVPVEPTEAMLANEPCPAEAQGIYRAMIAAASPIDTKEGE